MQTETKPQKEYLNLQIMSEDQKEADEFIEAAKSRLYMKGVKKNMTEANYPTDVIDKVYNNGTLTAEEMFEPTIQIKIFGQTIDKDVWGVPLGGPMDIVEEMRTEGIEVEIVGEDN